MKRSIAQARLRKTLRRHVAQGFERAVFAAPQTDDGRTAIGALEEIVEGTGQPLDDEAFEALVDKAAQAAVQGRVKQTFVLDARTRIKVDARHGRAKVQQLDPPTLAKMMGGKARALKPDTSAPLLRHIGIMNADGTISAKNAKKYKQINHFVELCRPTWGRLKAELGEPRPLRIVDLGCGNSYLTFVIAEALRLEEIPVRLLGIDRRTDVIERSQRRAEALGWTWMEFRAQAIDTFDLLELGGPPDLVVSLHACDTATDDALERAIRAEAQAIFAAPCCQHELAGQLQKGPVPSMIGHGLFKQDYAALLTDALRVELLDASGYKVDLLEFVASEHSAKNRLFRAHLRRGAGRPEALAAVAQRCEGLGVTPKLLTLLTGH